MRILFAFENCLPSPQADAEVFVTTAQYLAPLTSRSWLHVPLPRGADEEAIGRLAGMPVLRAWAPARPAALRHLCCGLTLVLRGAFRQADLVYTRNLWVAWMALLFGQRVVFDHYRPWPDQIPPLQFWIFRLMSNQRFLLNICHSDYTRRKYADLGLPSAKLLTIRNGFEPSRFASPIPVEAAKRAISVLDDQKTVVYTGRLNHKKGLGLVIEAARLLPDMLFILVGSAGEGPIEAASRGLPNIRIVPWQASESLAAYIFAADVLLIPPSGAPLAVFGSTVLPLKLFSYMASGRPILAGDTADVREVLRHDENAFLCAPDNIGALVSGLLALTQDFARATRLAAASQADSRGLTWSARAEQIISAVESRLSARHLDRKGWRWGDCRNWMLQSWRWLVHLVRHGGWVLPPMEVVLLREKEPKS